ncbi:DEAD/DEAH box helicase [Rossellomorea marisflavi]|uniref:DEAD/DEAH box helicase n=1 Tax=Rossellomorea marisflavi TaxID=189381 RepID=UPI0012F0DA9F|nr:DEAD/DEAH box helicase [Rossellomorea marisflavi]MDR4938922.1 DEAD/DEAH box helicase [Rossellomorea marisflavi]VXA99444.1 ATP-dependent RNA helicase; cold shock [Bacillus sp. 349Y]
MTKFADLNLSAATLKSIKRMGFEEATPIQASTIPVSLEGKDIIGQAQTGTGKTTAFGIPMIEKIDVKNPAVQGLIIAPTRELAIQVSEELYRISADKRARVLSVYGGQDIQRQIRAMKKNPHIIVGTPGRLLDHIKRKTLNLTNVHTLVLDEADEMLNMGFIDDIESILETVPPTRQTLLFSATMPDPIRRIAERFMTEPEVIKVKSKEVTVSNIEQFFTKVTEKEKFDVLSRLIDVQSPELAIVFGRTKRRVDELSRALSIRGYLAEGIHGDLSQARRMTVLKKFKEGRIDVLVATDVAARGLDISGVTHVYNFDIPQDPESYVHRIGRTGRAGKKGMSITFVTPREMGYLKVVEQTTKKKMTALKPPSHNEALEGQQRLALEKLTEATKESDLKDYYALAEEFLANHESIEAVAAAIRVLTKEPDTTPVDITEERPLPSRGGGRGNSRGGGYKGGSRSGKGGSGGGSRSGGYNRGGGSSRGGDRNRSGGSRPQSSSKRKSYNS